MRDICRRYGLEYSRVRKQILEMRLNALDLGPQDSRLAKENLLQYYKTKQTMTSNNKPDLDEYAMVVFTLPFESVFVESLFSMMNYNKNRYRASLLDESVSNVMHAKAVKSVVADSHVPFEADFELMKTAPLEHKLFF